MTTPYRSFDRVAHVYDETRGLPPEVERAVADGLAAAISGATSGRLEAGPSPRGAAPRGAPPGGASPRGAGFQPTADAYEASKTNGPRVLEVGIGTGRMAVPLAARGVRIAGVDIARSMVERLLEKRRDIDVALAESTRLPFRDAAFDAALFVHVLHLVPDVEATVRAAVRCVRPGGLLLNGGDDAQDSIRDQAEIIIREAAAPYTGEAMPAWRPYSEHEETVERLLQEASVSCERRRLATWTARTSARKMLGRLERRDFSSSWLIPEDAMSHVMAAATAQLETLFGGLDVEHEYPRSFSVLIARLRAG